MLENLLGTAWLLPVSGVVFGVVGITIAWLASRDFDRRYGPEK